MGSEIGSSHFSREDFSAFSRRLRDETELLKTWLREGRVSSEHPRAGFELEAWLVDADGQAAPENKAFLARLDDPLAVPELARFNVELNGAPLTLGGSALDAFHTQLGGLWHQAQSAAAGLDLRLAMIGILPTISEDQLSLANMSALHRYQALNEQILTLRNRRGIRLEIQGAEESVCTNTHDDVMMESAATSLQLHLQLPPRQAHRYYNAAVALSAATVAVAANSPFLFGRRLWEETRIPLFEQAVELTPPHGGHAGPFPRVTFGSGYARDAMFSLFVENRQHYPVLIPALHDLPADALAHLILHNGTVWRWNRPLVGFDEHGGCHLRLEHRVMAAGPSVIDTAANAAFFYGLVRALATLEPGVESLIPFPVAATNFYRAARDGLRATVEWGKNRPVPLRELILGELLPLAAAGLDEWGIDPANRDRYLGIIEARVRTGWTGAAWQCAYVERHGRDFPGLVLRYLEQQESGRPVHEWEL